MRKLIGGLFLAFAFMFIVILMIGVFAGKSHSSNAPDTPSESASKEVEAATPVNAVKLWSDYQANEVAADNLYKGRRLAVSGIVTAIKKDFADNVYVTFQSPNEFEQVHVSLKPEFQNMASQLQIGEPLVATCTGGTMIIGSPTLDDCSISRPEPPRPAPIATEQPEPAPAPVAETESAAQGGVQANQVFKASDGVVAPKILTTVSAPYTDLARANRREGSVLISLVVDKNGDPHNLTLVRSLGSGLDDNALAAVSHYKFSPAIDPRTQMPVACETSVEVNFSLESQ